MHLGLGYLLQGGKYEIVRYISSGGFGCTYEARHTLFRKTVAIKEFFVKDFCNRNEQGYVEVATQGKVELVNKLRAKFIDEATALYELQHPNIVRVTDVFEENGTAYYVMEYIDGLSLADLISQKGALAESEALGYICQVADALSYVHSKNRLHLDVKPQNIMIDRNGKAVLIDFGVSKQYDEANGENTSTLLGCTPGYAPIEQVGNNVVDFRPATDIYALGATLYKALSGVTPLAANLLACGDELAPLPSSVSRATRKAVEVAMDLNRHKRPQSIEEFLCKLKTASFDDDETRVGINPPRPLDTPPFEKVGEFSRTIIHDNEETRINSSSTPGGVQTESTKKTNKGEILAFIIVAVVLVGAVIGFVAGGSGDENISWDGTPEKEQETPTSAPQVLEEELPVANDTFSNRDFTVNGVSFKMVAVKGGTFQMGSNDGEDNEKPVHDVTLSDYYIGETEVTQELWQAVMGTIIRDQAKKGSWSTDLHGIGDEYPMYYISYEDCIDFVSKLNEKLKKDGQLPAGRKFRLPTEAEWEYAARGGKTPNDYEYSGSNDVDAVAWYDGNCSKTHPVKKGKKPNELGLYDMSGNVWEWCSDLYDSDYYSNSPRNNPQGPSFSPYSNRVLRGGGWNGNAQYCRVANRLRSNPAYRSYNIGMRLAF